MYPFLKMKLQKLYQCLFLSEKSVCHLLAFPQGDWRLQTAEPNPVGEWILEVGEQAAWWDKQGASVMAAGI